ncbi:MAG: hypothetical protein PHX60_04180 [Giesbergeria sp.]|uniref:hypothetical protein n=1 Tax=Giesbergeria sp. TaxID=2818473 RepID=UPI00260FCA8B|nr:hypothetical protein [Giesbergeria sp.]MDD2608878.1 hypothetical protein [Giesbergeria sp.]
MENFNPNRILITVGHPASGMADVQTLLQQLGMATPLAGKQHGMAAADISTYLLKRAGQKTDFLQPVVQIKPTPLWQSLALDLLLANDQQNFWGWADTQAIQMLDYWHEADPAFHFVLVYDHPAHALVRAFAQQSLDDAALAQLQQSWQHYHAALLHFYTRHPSRCLLVQATEVLTQPQSLIDALCARLNLALHASAALQLPTQPDAQQLYLAQAVLQQVQWPAADDEELQAAADVPQSELPPILPLTSWNVSVDLRQQLGYVQQTLEETQHTLAERETRIQAQEAEKSQREQALKESNEENELLLAQLHQVQEELERFYLEKQALQQTQEKLEQQGQAWQKQLAQTQQTLAERDEKITALQNQPANTAQLQELEEENHLLLAQLHQVQEELERYYLENQALKQGQPTGKKEPSSPSKTYPVAYYGAADRVKQQLSYRLGHTMVQQSRSFKGILTLPGALQQQVRQFKQDQQARAGQKLPPIERYADAHEAERVRQHLSYRLGKILLENYRTPIGWIKLPFAMRREVKDFRQHRVQSHH